MGVGLGVGMGVGVGAWDGPGRQISISCSQTVRPPCTMPLHWLESGTPGGGYIYKTNVFLAKT
jgi:hypothetical protein